MESKGDEGSLCERFMKWKRDGQMFDTNDDVVIYDIFMLDEGFNDRQKRSELILVEKFVEKLKKEHLNGYLWQREEFKLNLIYEDSTWKLQGSTNVGESLVDEWLIVWILREISQEFTGMWIRVVDGDGQFLACEAAQYVPAWLDPNNDEYRVWINNGCVKLINVTSNAGGQDDFTLKKALQCLAKADTLEIFTSRCLNESAFNRIKNHPEDIVNNLHAATLRLPRKLAWIIHEIPESVTLASEAFYNRYPVSLAALRRKRKGKFEKEENGLTFKCEDLVNISVKFTRISYAHLHTQEYHIPEDWSEEVNQARNIKNSDTRMKNLRQLTLGLKLTTGYELLLLEINKGENKLIYTIDLLLKEFNHEGHKLLPTNEEITKWYNQTDTEDDSWMNVSLDDINNESLSPMNNLPKWNVMSGTEQVKRIVERTREFIEGKSDDVTSSSGNSSEFSEYEEETAVEKQKILEQEVSENAFDEELDSILSLPPHYILSAGTGRAIHGPEPPPGYRNVKGITMVIKKGEDSLKEDDAIRESLNLVGKKDPDEMNEEVSKFSDYCDAVKGELEEYGVFNGDKIPNSSVGEIYEDESRENINIARNFLTGFQEPASINGPMGNLMKILNLNIPKPDNGKE